MNKSRKIDYSLIWLIGSIVLFFGCWAYCHPAPYLPVEDAQTELNQQTAKTFEKMEKAIQDLVDENKKLNGRLNTVEHKTESLPSELSELREFMNVTNQTITNLNDTTRLNREAIDAQIRINEKIFSELDAR